ncbi:MAG: MFS transporter [Pseudonocardiaceae bacterium]
MPDSADLRQPSAGRAQRRTLIVLVGTQAAAGVGVAAGIAVSNLVAAELSGSEVIGGAASTAMVIGAAFASYAIARVADRSGRRAALALGYALGGLGAIGAVVAVSLGSWPALLAALVPFGAAMAAGLAARFAATDLADPRRVARELAIVLWAVTVGVLVGPNLADPAQRWAGALGLVPATGPYLLCAAAFGLAGVATVIGLRPDPLVLARELSEVDARHGRAGPARSPWGALRSAPTAQLAVAGIALCHLVMVGLMSLTPVHMDHGGASLQLVGLVISLHIAAMYALSPLFGVLADRIGRRRVLALGSVLLVIAGGMTATAGGADAGLLTVGLVVLGLGWSAGLVGGSALLVEAVPLADRPGMQGLSDVTMNVAGALGGVLAGVTVAVGSYALLGLVTAALAALFGFATLVHARRWAAS